MHEPNELEEWRPCPDFIRYEVSSYGRVRLVSTGTILRKHVNKRTGRLYVRLVPNVSEWRKHPVPRPLPCGKLNYGKVIRKTRFTGPLIARAFLGPRPPGMQVDHTRGKLVETIDSLEYVTQSENCQRAYDRGDQPSERPLGGLTDNQHDAIKVLFKSGLSQVKIAKQFGCTNSTVSRIVNGKTKSARFPSLPVGGVQL